MDDGVYRYEISYTDKKKTTFTYYVYTRSDMLNVVKDIESKGFKAKTQRQKMDGFRLKALQDEAI